MSKKVLLIEDSTVLHRLVELCLRDTGLRLEACTDGEAGLELARKDPPDLILLDVGLPGANGFDVLTTLRSRPESRSIPIVVLTGHSDAEAEARRRGATTWLCKPFRTRELRDLAVDLTQGERITAGDRSG